MKERFKYIPSIVMLLAGFIACITTIVNKYDIIETLIIILVVLVSFYIVGLIIRALFNKFIIVEVIEGIKESEEAVEGEEDENPEASEASLNPEEESEV
ncbi:MAG: hypothetical protein K2M73_08465 [Lachnospiraceae bacterium]|nr:hypothetical protein [Lachnospiraceae bacterium]